MKKKILSLAAIPFVIPFAGCDESEEPAAEVAQAEVVQEVAPASEPEQPKSSLEATADALRDALPELREEAIAATYPETTVQAAEEEIVKVETEVVTPEVDKAVVESKEVAAKEMEKAVVESKEVAVKEVEQVAEPEEESSLMSKTLSVAGGLASQLDLPDLSWDSVAEIPYDDKAQLLVWATEQANSWKDKLSAAAMEKGTSMLDNLGDSGWQGALGKVLEAINGIRESSPDTWELARGALISAWDNFEAQANKFLSTQEL